MAVQTINEAFGGGSFGCYLVGSATKRPDWRDIDIVCIMQDEAFEVLFPDAGEYWEHDARWLLMTIAISRWLSERCGHLVDFKFQKQSHANKYHRGPRHAIGLVFKKSDA